VSVLVEAIQFPEPGGELPEESLIDLEEFALLEDLADQDPLFLTELIDTYCGQTQDLLAALTVAVEADAKEEFLRGLHTLCGSSRYLGARPLSRMCAALEREGLESTANFSLQRAAGVLFPLVVRTCLALNQRRPEPASDPSSH
jgi:HPt (histidine-containing phosphotransfer) domain-containing protein